MRRSFTTAPGLLSAPPVLHQQSAPNLYSDSAGSIVARSALWCRPELQVALSHGLHGRASASCPSSPIAGVHPAQFHSPDSSPFSGQQQVAAGQCIALPCTSDVSLPASCHNESDSPKPSRESSCMSASSPKVKASSHSEPDTDHCPAAPHVCASLAAAQALLGGCALPGAAEVFTGTSTSKQQSGSCNHQAHRPDRETTRDGPGGDTVYDARSNAGKLAHNSIANGDPCIDPFGASLCQEEQIYPPCNGASSVHSEFAVEAGGCSTEQEAQLHPLSSSPVRDHMDNAVMGKAKSLLPCVSITSLITAPSKGIAAVRADDLDQALTAIVGDSPLDLTASTAASPPPIKTKPTCRPGFGSSEMHFLSVPSSPSSLGCHHGSTASAGENGGQFSGYTPHHGSVAPAATTHNNLRYPPVHTTPPRGHQPQLSLHLDGLLADDQSGSSMPNTPGPGQMPMESLHFEPTSPSADSFFTPMGFWSEPSSPAQSAGSPSSPMHRLQPWESSSRSFSKSPSFGFDIRPQRGHSLGSMHTAGTRVPGCHTVPSSPMTRQFLLAADTVPCDAVSMHHNSSPARCADKQLIGQSAPVKADVMLLSQAHQHDIPTSPKSFTVGSHQLGRQTHLSSSFPGLSTLSNGLHLAPPPAAGRGSPKRASHAARNKGLHLHGSNGRSVRGSSNCRGHRSNHGGCPLCGQLLNDTHDMQQDPLLVSHKEQRLSSQQRSSSPRNLHRRLLQQLTSGLKGKDLSSSMSSLADTVAGSPTARTSASAPVSPRGVKPSSALLCADAIHNLSRSNSIPKPARWKVADANYASRTLVLTFTDAALPKHISRVVKVRDDLMHVSCYTALDACVSEQETQTDQTDRQTDGKWQTHQQRHTHTHTIGRQDRHVLLLSA